MKIIYEEGCFDELSDEMTQEELDALKKEIENFPTHVIKVNNIDYVPVTNKALKPVDFNGIKYIPVYTAPKDKIHLL